MHDLIQDMGREIVTEEAWNEVGDRSRLWHHEDILQVLVDNNRFEHLTCMNSSSCCMVTEFPDVSGAMKLRELRLGFCHNLVRIHESVGRLPNLVFLSASYCEQLKSCVNNPFAISRVRFLFPLHNSRTLPRHRGDDV
ncbi:hypothetical protein Fmac_022555 [Flemingia macrophylla]|uniref:Uncharacterized protein n=1 Tax=Flemingia macrophylla TaxID=520843 RepID=A0ABD1M017_9FABA